MKTLEECRSRIDEIDRQLVRLFEARMEVAGDVAAYKKEHGLAVLDASREEIKLQQITEMTDERFRDDILQLYRVILDLSKSYQNRLLGMDSNA